MVATENVPQAFFPTVGYLSINENRHSYLIDVDTLTYSVSYLSFSVKF